MKLPTYIIDILNILTTNHHQAYLVGGCVRDSFLQLSIHDYDITTSCLPQDMVTLFKQHNYEIKQEGIKHGSIKVIKDQHEVEITTFRKEYNYQNHRHPGYIEFCNDLVSDLARRDFTMNAIAYHPDHGYIDPFKGIDDINLKTIRSINEPNQSFQDDALRILRAIRFSTTLKFNIEANTKAAIINNASLVQFLSKDRLREEFCRILMGNQDFTLHMLKEYGLLTYLIPSLIPTINFPQFSPWHIYDVFTHTDIALNHTKGYPLILKLVIVYHDIGKPNAYYLDEQSFAHFHKHPIYSAKQAKQALMDLNFDKNTIQEVVTFIEDHDYRMEATPQALRKLLVKYNYNYQKVSQLLDIQIADNYAKNLQLALNEIRKCMRLKNILITLQQQETPLTLKDLCINGHDLVELGYQGKDIAQILNLVHQYVLEEPSRNQKDIILNYINKQQS